MGRFLLPAVAAAVVAGFLAVAAPASAADERPAVMPSGTYHVPAYRPAPAATRLVVCRPDSGRRIARLDGAARRLGQRLLGECSYRHIQRAVDAVRRRGTTIYVLPGRYREEPSRATAGAYCARLARRDVLSYAEQRSCPHAHNLVGVFGDEHPGDAYDVCDGPRCDLQIEGTGGRPDDVVVEGGYRGDGTWAARYGIRADRAGGFYLRNLTTQLFGHGGVHVVQTDGFAVERALSRWNGRHGFAMFAGDHGVFADCEAAANGAAGIAPDAAADLGGRRFSVEVRRCRSHHNVLGYAGTASDSVYVHDNEFVANSTGVRVDSAAVPGRPQNRALFVANRVGGNNADHYRRVRDGTCRRPPRTRGAERGVVCPATAVPVGTGMLLAGGNDNTYTGNLVYDNWRYGFMQYAAPARDGAERGPAGHRDTSHGNRYIGNLLGYAPAGGPAPNGLDFWWDEQGDRNCWQGNVSAWGRVRGEPAALPGCPRPSGGGPYARDGDAGKAAALAACPRPGDEAAGAARTGPGCDWLRVPRRPVPPVTAWRGPGRI